MKSILLILICSGFATLVKASVTIDFQIGNVLNSSLVSVPVGTVGILLADNNGTGLPTSTELVGAILSGGGSIGDSQILSVMQAVNAGGGLNAFVSGLLSISLTGGLTGGAGITGTDLAFYWFPGITTVGSTVTDGQSYGVFRTDLIDGPSGGSLSFNLPSDGASGSIYAFTLNESGGYPNNTFTANLTATAVPEPSRMILTVIGLGAFLMRRRRAA